MSAPRGEPRQRHLSSFHLEGLRLGVATEPERAWADAHLAGCARCAALAASLQTSRTEFEREVLPRTRAPLRSRAGATAPAPRWRWRWLVGGLTAPLAVAAVLLLAGRRTPTPTI